MLFTAKETPADKLTRKAPTPVIASFYMDNIPSDIVRYQAAVIRNFAPPDFEFKQILTSRTHAEALDDFMTNEPNELVLFLDIDCVPLNTRAIPDLAAQAADGKLAGCIQRANHIENDAHLYVGPFCMALTRKLYDELGRPSFKATDRGDVGEELTYRCEALSRPVHTLWPSAVETPLWDLNEANKFGLNTEYDDSFLHSFAIRNTRNQDRFVERCREMLC